MLLWSLETKVAVFYEGSETPVSTNNIDFGGRGVLVPVLLLLSWMAVFSEEPGIIRKEDFFSEKKALFRQSYFEKRPLWGEDSLILKRDLF